MDWSIGCAVLESYEPDFFLTAALDTAADSACLVVPRFACFAVETVGGLSDPWMMSLAWAERLRLLGSLMAGEGSGFFAVDRAALEDPATASFFSADGLLTGAAALDAGTCARVVGVILAIACSLVPARLALVATLTLGRVGAQVPAAI